MIMQLKELLTTIESLFIEGDLEREVTGISYDSRRVAVGHVFIATMGEKVDGHSYIEQALARGASAVVYERNGFTAGKAAKVQVADSRKAMAQLAATFYEHPDRKLKVVGVTGTNGKTTVGFMIKHLLEEAGHKTGLLGTVRYEIGDRVIPASRTTPEALEVFEYMAQMVKSGCEAVVMEVSSHALVQKRAFGIDFDVAVFTNLTQDHLDYHKTMDQYFEAKAILFRNLGTGEKKGTAVLNTDDARGSYLANKAGLNATIVTYGLEGDPSLKAQKVALTREGTTFELHTAGHDYQVEMPLIGRHNISNLVAAIGAVHALGVPYGKLTRSSKKMRGVPGRLEPVFSAAPFSVFVDYAHTDDALENVLRTIREIKPGRVLLVFGCGGNRDTKKRLLMGKVAAELADHTIITTDNPRKEKPEEIIKQIEKGFGTRKNYEVIPDRKEAIFHALSIAKAKDVILIAGKGHENYQELADTIIPFDDKQVVEEGLKWISTKPWKS
mgnify:CR=1 FL=1